MIIKRIMILSTLLCISFTLQAASTPEDCAAITDDSKRLKCYDSLLQKKSIETPKEVIKPTSPTKPKKPTLAPRPEEEQTPPRSKKESTTEPKPEVTEEEKFGAEQMKNPPQPKKKELNQINSRAIGIYKMWEKGLEVTLENGQVWEITDNRSAYHMADNPNVTIEKTMFGGYLLGIEGLNKRFRVKRKK